MTRRPVQILTTLALVLSACGSPQPSAPTPVPPTPMLPAPMALGLNGTYRGVVIFAENSECQSPINMILALRQDGDTVTGSWLIPATNSGLANGGPLLGRVVADPSKTRFGQFKCELTNVDSDYYAFDTTIAVEDGGAFAGPVFAGACAGTANFARSTPAGG